MAVTGATGFLGRYIVEHLLERGHAVRAWHRAGSDRAGLVGARLEWVEGALGDALACRALVDGADAVVHGALQHTPGRYRGGEGDLCEYVRANVLGTIELIEAARRGGAARFVYISSRAVYDRRLPGRPLDEDHPTWPASHYGAHKAAVEMFVHSYGAVEGFAICALRPTGVYGLARPVERSKWFPIVEAVDAGAPIATAAGGTEVHALDVARAVEILLHAEGVAGQIYNCHDRYVAAQEVAEIARRLSGSSSRIERFPQVERNVMETARLRGLGVTFGGTPLLETTVGELLQAVRALRRSRG